MVSKLFNDIFVDVGKLWSIMLFVHPNRPCLVPFAFSKFIDLKVSYATEYYL